MSENTTEAPAAPEKPAEQPQEGGEQEPKTFDAEYVANLRKEAAKYRTEAKAHAAELEQFREATKSEQEKALDAARKEGQAEARKESAPRLVAAEFRIAAAGRLTAEQVAELTEDLDLVYSKYLTEDGEIDVERIAKKVDALAPEARKIAPTFGGGPRRAADKPEPTPGIGRLRDAYASSTK